MAPAISVPIRILLKPSEKSTGLMNEGRNHKEYRKTEINL